MRGKDCLLGARMPVRGERRPVRGMRREGRREGRRAVCYHGGIATMGVGL